MCPIHTETAGVAKFWCKFRPLVNKPGFNYVLLRSFVSLLTPETIPGLPMAFQWGFGKKRREEIENRIFPNLHKSARPPVGWLVSGWPLLRSALVGESGLNGSVVIYTGRNRSKGLRSSPNSRASVPGQSFQSHSCFQPPSPCSRPPAVSSSFNCTLNKNSHDL